MFEILLVSNFEGGFQPVTIATAASALISEECFEISVLDTYVDGINEKMFDSPDLVAISIPLFDSLLPGIEIAKKVRAINSKAHVTFFGQYATLNSSRLVEKYGDSCVVGEWEEPLVKLAHFLAGDSGMELSGIRRRTTDKIHPNFARDKFVIPNRDLLPPLYKYPQVQINKLCESEQIVGTTEIARGCHHKCLYCSVFAAYGGKVLLIPEDLVIADVTNMVNNGATHITFIDADFFNSKQHGIKILRKLNNLFPNISYDFTTRVDHILENEHTLMEMSSLNVKFITSALEFPTQEVLDAVAKQTSLEDIERAIKILRKINIKLNPTFIMFNPWINLEDLVFFKQFVEKNDLDNIIDPIQYETRLHLYKGSPLLNSSSLSNIELEEKEFHLEWKHPDPMVDQLYFDSLTPVEEGIFKRCCLKC